MKLAHPQDMSYTTCYSTAALLFHTIGQWKGKAKAQQVGKNGRGPWMHGSSEQQFCCAWSRVRGVWSVPELKDHSHTQLEWKSACSAYSVLHTSGTSCAYATQKDNKCFGLFHVLAGQAGDRDELWCFSKFPWATGEAGHRELLKRAWALTHVPQ